VVNVDTESTTVAQNNGKSSAINVTYSDGNKLHPHNNNNNSKPTTHNVVVVVVDAVAVEVVTVNLKYNRFLTPAPEPEIL